MRLQWARARLDRAEGVLQRVEVFNDEVRTLLTFLGLAYDFGQEHRNRVRRVIDRVVEDFGAVEFVETARRESAAFLDADPAEISDAWLRWPITAGGLGIFDPLVEVLAYEMTYDSDHDRQPPPERTEGWQDGDTLWTNYYRHLIRKMDGSPPRYMREGAIDHQVDDFIARNRKLHGDEASDELSSYWRWILHTYGPQILETYGTFRFLMTELVPLRLILQS